MNILERVKRLIFWQHSILLVAAALAVGSLVGRYYAKSEEVISVTQLRANSSEYRFINPLILVADTRDLRFEMYEPVKDAVSRSIRDSLKSGQASKISFYFRDLNSGEWVGLGQEDKYAPASLLKVATLMAYLTLADKNSQVLLETAHYTPTDISSQHFKPHQLSEGNYTARELLRQMIIESDNDAMRALHSLHVQEQVEIYNDLGLPNPLTDDEPADFLSPREYSRFFRTFYNGAYLSHLYSDEALGLLSQTKFDKGLRAGLPAELMLAHKFGEYNDGKTGDQELHDCGIVYYPKRPYFVCVMTKGQDYDSLARAIAGISEVVYKEVKNLDK